MAAVKIDGMKELEKNLRKFNINLEAAIDDAVLITAVGVQRTAVDLIKSPSKGKVYKRSANVTHIASRKGQAPNKDSGDLMKSIAIEHKKGSQVAHVGTNLEYGKILELSKDRPWLQPSLDKNISNFADKVISVVEAKIRNA